MQMELKDSKTSTETTNNGANNATTASSNINANTTKPMPAVTFLHQVLKLNAKNSTTDTPHYTPTIALGTTIEDTSPGVSAPNTNNNSAQSTYHTVLLYLAHPSVALKRPRDSEGTSEPAPKRVK